MRNSPHTRHLIINPVCANTRKYTRYEEMSLPVQVIGYSLDSKEFKEFATTQNFSAGGARLVLQTIVQRGAILYLSLPLPSRLRHYDWEEELYCTFVEVKFTKRLVGGGCAMGVSFIGKTPPKNFEGFQSLTTPPR